MARHTQYKGEYLRKKQQSYKEEIRSLVLELQSMGLHPSYARVKEQLKSPLRKKYTILHELLLEVREELGVPKRR